MERMEAIIARINEQESRITLLEHRLSPTELRAAEPAPGSDAEHPPVGYVLVPHASGEVIEADWIVWSFDRGPWKPLRPDSVGDRAHGGFHPMARPIPAKEGDSRLTESVAIPVGWAPAIWYAGIEEAGARKIGGRWITPDTAIPWGEGYEAILPSEAKPGDFALVQFGDDATTARDEWTAYEVIKSWCRDTLAWRRRIPATTPTEPARDLSDKIAESVVQDLQQACYDRDELRATVERLEAELETTKRLLAESLVERDRLKNLHDARKVRIEGFRDVLRERLGDLV